MERPAGESADGSLRVDFDRRPMLNDQRRIGPIWLAAADVRPDEGERAQISADTVIVGQSVRPQQSPRRVAVAERAVWSLSTLRDGKGGRSSGESRLVILIVDFDSPHSLSTPLVPTAFKCRARPI